MGSHKHTPVLNRDGRNITNNLRLSESRSTRYSLCYSQDITLIVIPQIMSGSKESIAMKTARKA